MRLITAAVVLLGLTVSTAAIADDRDRERIEEAEPIVPPFESATVGTTSVVPAATVPEEESVVGDETPTEEDV